MEEGMSGFCIKPSPGANFHRGGPGGNGSAGTKCGRWNPTAEQVKVLTDLFRSGLQTPSTDQIQKISAQLSFYGKIESKNVFYWFQNHKARERQKRRKVSSAHYDDHYHQQHRDFVRRENRISTSSKRFDQEMNQIVEPERVMETLQLFPLNPNPFEESDSEKRKLHANDDYFRETAVFSYPSFGAEMDHPPLDLRLSFM